MHHNCQWHCFGLLRKIGIFYIVVEDYYKITLFIGLVLIVHELCDNDCVDAADVVAAQPPMFVA